MKTQRRWLNSVITAAACEDVSMPWATRNADTRSDKVAATVASQAQVTTAASGTHHYAIAAR